MWQLTFVVVECINLKIADFYLGNSILWNAQIAAVHTIFIKIFPGESAPGPPSMSRAVCCYSLPMHLLCNPLFR